MNNRVILLVITIFLYSLFIKIFKFFKQTERKEGLRSHKVKEGTITMGGIIFTLVPLFFISYDSRIKVIILSTLFYMFIGFIDDLLIVILKKNDGLSANLKLILELIISVYIFYMYLGDKNTILFSVDIKWLFGIFILLYLMFYTNAWNLLDGVDGLCAGCSLIVCLTLMYIALRKGEALIFYMLLCFFLTLFVFWCFNLPKAFLFMGDTGSLSLGALFSLTSIYLEVVWPFIILSGLFIFDTLSVVIQVSYYKLTKGKRIFKMAPFHHHLELSGFNEVGIDLIFYLIQIILAIVAVICCKLS